ncbi:MAG: hypothetical protein HYV09_24200 [Deltaproteobacteria bacterium]|nr:hypothetical protein [Deltaproteobacteria bacterium]
MRALSLGLFAIAALGCGSEETVVDDPPAHRPLDCAFEVDEAFAALTLPGGQPITQHWEMTSTPRGALYAPVQKREFAPWLTGIARFDGTWTVEPLAGEWQNIWDVAASDEEAWMAGEVGRYPTTPAIVQRNGGAWTEIDRPAGTHAVHRLLAVGRTLFAIGVEENEPVYTPFFARRDATGWKRLAAPSEWPESWPGPVALVGTEVVVGFTVRPTSGLPKDASRGLLARVDGDRLVPLTTSIELPPIGVISGSGLHDLLVLGGLGGYGQPTVHWLDTVGGRGKLVHVDREWFADVWSPRPGVALLAPSHYHAGRLTVLDGLTGPREVELWKPGELHYVARFAPEGDGRTVHFLAHLEGRKVQHVRGVCR